MGDPCRSVADRISLAVGASLPLVRLVR